MLKSGWYLEGLIDYEYQYYRLKAYEKMVKRDLFLMKLYPHIENVKSLMKESSTMLDNIKSVSNDDSELAVFLNDILSDSIEIFSDLLNECQNVFDAIYRNISLSLIDVSKSYTGEVVVICTTKGSDNVFVEMYRNTNVIDPEDGSFLINMETINSYNYEGRNPELFIEEIKDTIVKANESLSTINFVWAKCHVSAPYFETVREVLKRKMHNFLLSA